jgi:hypothetical protein
MELFEPIVEWFVANFEIGAQGSLQVMSQDATAKRSSLKIYAKSDEEMFQRLREFLSETSSVRFIAMGEGRVMGREGQAVNVLMLYLQDPAYDKAQRAVLPYDKVDGKIQLSEEWINCPQLADNWLPVVKPKRGFLGFKR